MWVIYFHFIIRWMTDFQVSLSFEVTVESIKTFVFSFWQTVLVPQMLISCTEQTASNEIPGVFLSITYEIPEVVE